LAFNEVEVALHFPKKRRFANRLSGGGISAIANGAVIGPPPLTCRRALCAGQVKWDGRLFLFSWSRKVTKEDFFPQNVPVSL
jgi:hypothetical protein